MTSSETELARLPSPQDLCGLEHVPRLLETGVRTFEIEGGLKSSEYVYVSTLAYRRLGLGLQG